MKNKLCTAVSTILLLPPFVLLFLRRWEWALESPVAEIMIYSCTAIMLLSGVFTALAYRSGVKTRWMQVLLVVETLYAVLAVAILGLIAADML